jgi:hypothetical protein
MERPDRGATMPTEWFCQIDDDEFGPVTSTALRALAASGRLSGTDRVRKGKVGNWVTASHVAGLFDASNSVSKAPPPIPVAIAKPESDEYLVEEAEDDEAVAGIAREHEHQRSLGLHNVHSIKECISKEEKKQRLFVILISVLMWFV